MKENNAICKICGSPYHCCINCEKNKNNFISYKLFGCSHNCFKIYATITSGDSKETQKETLTNLDLTNLETFNEEVKIYIKDILDIKEEVKVEIKEVVENIVSDVITENKEETKTVKAKKIG